jgi:hypothetical protein
MNPRDVPKDEAAAALADGKKPGARDSDVQVSDESFPASDPPAVNRFD